MTRRPTLELGKTCRDVLHEEQQGVDREEESNVCGGSERGVLRWDPVLCAWWEGEEMVGKEDVLVMRTGGGISSKSVRFSCVKTEEEEEEEEEGRESSSESSSIGADAESSLSLSSSPLQREDGGGEEEVESKRKEEPLNSRASLEESLPIKRGLSSFYNGKAKSFASIRDVAATLTVADLAKPENPFNRNRRIQLAYKSSWRRRASCGSLSAAAVPIFRPLLPRLGALMEEGVEEGGDSPSSAHVLDFNNHADFEYY